MICPNCGENNPDDALSCIKCGIALSIETYGESTLQPEMPVIPNAVPKGIKGFNFGAFFLPLLWSLYYGRGGWFLFFL